MPNYVSRMWMRSEEGIAAALYGPSELRTTINGQPVTITQETDYPFRDTITFTCKLAKPNTFTLALRLPEWCGNPNLRINDHEVSIDAKPGTFAPVKREFHDGDIITLRLPMTVTIENWLGGKTAVISRGPLVYSLKIAEKRVESMREPDAIRGILKGNNVQGFPAVEFFPQSEWRYGMESALKTTPEKIQVKESPMTENPFLADSVPVRLAAPLRSLKQWAADWKPILDPPPADLKQSPQNPTDLPTEADLKSPGEIEMMTLVPYGSTHLRLTTLPLI